MQRCDVLLVNSLHDGMNLVAKEWAVVSERPGALIVSESAGVTTEAGDGAFQIAPLDVEGTAQALVRALDLPDGERAVRLARFRARVERWTAADWLAAQLAALGLDVAARPDQVAAGLSLPPALPAAAVPALADACERAGRDDHAASPTPGRCRSRPLRACASGAPARPAPRL